MSLALVAVFASWAGQLLVLRGGLTPVGRVASIDLLPAPGWSLAWVVVAVAAFAGVLVRHRDLRGWRTSGALAVLFGGATVAAAASPVGHHVTILGVALLGAVTVGLARSPTVLTRLVEGMGSDRRRDLVIAGVLWGVVFAVDAVFSMHRHAWFGSGSWDHGCMVHNFYRAAHFLPTVSTVLGGVDFLGDHFMVGIYLYAPVVWLWDSGYSVLAIQAAQVSAVAPAIYLMARHHGIGRFAGGVLALGTALSFGLQSAVYFDAHGITVGFGFLAFGLWAFETGRLRTATVLLFVFSLFKESLGAYVAALGLLAIVRGATGRDRRHVAYGAAWMAYGVVWFVLVNRVFMPAFAAQGLPPEPHETYADFGPTVFTAAQGILANPLKAFVAVFVPMMKLESHAVTLGHTGLVALLSPQVAVAALPLVAERFLSSKSTMWEMGYHYAGPLCLYAGWAAVRGFSRARSIVGALLEYLGRGLGAHRRGVLVAYLAFAAVLETRFGYRHPANFYTWQAGYFSRPAQKVANERAVKWLARQGRAARVAAQNRILPHLANRPFIYRLGEYEKADWVVLSVRESAWPYDAGLPHRLAARLYADPGWKLVFSEEETAVFARVEATDRAAVPAAGALRLGPGPPKSRVKTAR